VRLSHQKHVDTAYFLLSFAFKTSEYVRSEVFDKATFDRQLPIHGLKRITFLPKDEFQSIEDVIAAAENIILICFGAVADALWEAYREVSGRESSDLMPLTQAQDKLPAFVFMLRCNFSHGIAAPKWQIHEKYRTEYQLGDHKIDLRNLNGTFFEWSHIGGPEKIWTLRDVLRAENLI